MTLVSVSRIGISVLQKICPVYENYSNKNVRETNSTNILFISIIARLAVGHAKKNRGELLRNIDAHYYGYMDDDDGLLIPSEEKCEKEAIRKKIEEWKTSESTEMNPDEPFNVPEMNVRVSKFEWTRDELFSRF